MNNINHLARLIPVLLVDNGRLIKTIKFQKQIYLGDPINTIKIFNDKEVDEIVVLDITATENNKEPDYKFIASLAEECFMPVCYGGGICNIDQVKKILSLGIEKISLNTALFNNRDLVKEVARKYGSQAVVASIDVKTDFFGHYHVYKNRGKYKVNIDVFEFINELEFDGVGELLINFIDRDGMYKGYDVSFIKKVVENTKIPVTACGGAKDLEDVRNMLKVTGVAAAAAGSIFVFSSETRGVLINYPNRLELVNY
ncbi:MAG: AglZ/HisF2 family acetamidino modification protein [Microgenomates group bacterium]